MGILVDFDMKPLLSKLLRPFILYVVLMIGISIPIYYLVMEAIWKHELDEYNDIISHKTAGSFNQLKLSRQELEESLRLWNRIQPSTEIHTTLPTDNLEDSIYNITRNEPYNLTEKKDRYRCLSRVIYINDQPYRFVIQTNIEESRETIIYLAATSLLIMILIIAGLLYLNKKISRQIWKPFQLTISYLKKFNLNQQEVPELPETNIKEFSELNQCVENMTRHSIGIFRSQKEFTENASHELQTPLAIIKNKLDLLLQTPGLTKEQYQLSEDMNAALLRITQINKNLLLLVKIENKQFERNKNIEIDRILKQSLQTLKEYMEEKQLIHTENIESPVQKDGSSGLTEILCNNLLLNAIRNTPEKGKIVISLNNQQLTISNSGHHPLNLEDLFSRFSKSSKSVDGTGLGLAIIKEICKFHQWEIVYDFDQNFHNFKIRFKNSDFLQS